MTPSPGPISVTILVVAKAPIPGLAKTRLAATVGDRAAADIAAAALLDTLDAVAATPVTHRVVAMTGDLEQACRAEEIHDRLAGFTVIAQRGDGFADRLANAHSDSATVRQPVLQIGMDTPQVSADLLAGCARRLLDAEAVLGMARDGGWWVLGVSDGTSAGCLRDVPMSQSDTGAVTLAALEHTGISVTLVEELHDVDTVDDIPAVRAACSPSSRFAQVTQGL
ncbi:TIGR04282 family arsenosugar biosynthesis glycosyltransferase [Mycolicibacterium psychrotolerans]|uniref:TIGR04282 family arsenosugar biosynthesis glycosyltransferase n=1 Tax=Mycolicibacterium psychrotolerans TaxID=216929 RepID=UPI003D666064